MSCAAGFKVLTPEYVLLVEVVLHVPKILRFSVGRTPRLVQLPSLVSI